MDLTCEMQPKVKILVILALGALWISACKLLETVETWPGFQPTNTPTLTPPATLTLAPTLTLTPEPTATIYRGLQDTKNGHWYLLVNQERSWRTAHEYCAGMGAHLVTLSDAAENQFVFGISTQTWLGASDEEQEGVWKWITGEPTTYTNWAEGEPNNCGQPDCQPEHYLMFAETPAQWNDVPALKLPFICEWDQ